MNLCRLTPVGNFAAAFLAIYDTKTGQLTYCNAGHQPEPWLLPVSPDEAIRTLSDARFLLLGVEEEYEFCCSQCELKPGDKFIIVSDGIVESCNQSDDYFGTERVETILQANRDSKPDALMDKIFTEVYQFSNTEKCIDDCTILAFEIKKVS